EPIDMKFLSLYKPAGYNGTHCMPDEETMAQMGQMVTEMTSAGKLLETGPFVGSRGEILASRCGDKIVIEEGPFGLERAAAGYAILKADSKEELAEQITRFLNVAGEGTCEIRQIIEF